MDKKAREIWKQKCCSRYLFVKELFFSTVLNQLLFRLAMTPLTATVRPSATPSSQQPPSSNKYAQLSRTASIRPLAHTTAPTAMISPTVPMTSAQGPPPTTGPSNLVASVSALPSTSSFVTGGAGASNVAEVQGRNIGAPGRNQLN